MKMLVFWIILIITQSAFTQIEIDLNSIDTLIQRKEDIYKRISECSADSGFSGQTSNALNSCVQGDIVLWAGLSCFAAHLAGDQYIIDKSCQDVSRAQDLNGRWWRGESRIENQAKDAFSRDMAYGVVSYMYGESILSGDQVKNERIKKELQAWWDYIENEGQGIMMCPNASDTRCRLYGGARILLHALGSEIGAINEQNKNYKVVKKGDKKVNVGLWRTEILTTPIGYRTHLNAIGLIFKYLLGKINDDQYKKIAQQIYKKDRANPFYEFLYLGNSPQLIKHVLNKCPAIRGDTSVKHPYIWSAAWWLQDDSKERSWEIGSGHECIFIINLILAQNEGKVKLPNNQKLNPVKCEGQKNYLGNYNDLNICKARPHFALSMYKCQNENGIIWNNNGKQYCLIAKSSFWKAREIQTNCPKNMSESTEEFVGYPVCHNKNFNKMISLPKCNNKKLNAVIFDENQNPKYCMVNHGQFYERKKISNICPKLHSQFMGSYLSESWPVCKAAKKIEENECSGDYTHKNADHCLKIRKGWYSYHEFKNLCPWGKTHTGLYKDGKPVCKARASFKIKKKNCDKKSGTQYEGYCVWEENDHFRARKLK